MSFRILVRLYIQKLFLTHTYMKKHRYDEKTHVKKHRYDIAYIQDVLKMYQKN